METLLQQLAREEEALARVEKQREQARAVVQALREQIAATRAADQASSTSKTATVVSAPIPTTAHGKVRLFSSLFRGRTDVFPKLWVNTTKNSKGYAPACANEWKRGVCEKPKVKCGECPNQAFITVDDQVILDHLQGRHVIGVYPLLKDETCWFLAADFDKKSWMDDVAALLDTCDKVGVPAVVERSRSGNGAHVWFLFSSPVSAVIARKMGCYLITETMARRHQLGMESYDRLFPNQDTMPSGGFGNLIALPLQHGPRQSGNSVFIDREFVPYPDQWAYLASLPRMDPATVDAIAQDATSRGQVVGVPFAEPADEAESAAPWTRPPSRRVRPIRITEDLPKEIRAVLAQRLFVEKTGLPSPLINQIKRLAAFQNPEFYKKQKMRLSTALTPRVISCAEELPNYIALPRGCRGELESLLGGLPVSLKIEDERQSGEMLDVSFRGELTTLQEQAVTTLLKNDIGVFVAPPGIGKTVIGTALIATRARTTLILVHRTALLDQWRTQLSVFLGVEPKEIGQIGGGKRRPNGRLDVAMIQGLVRKDKVDDIVASYGHVIVDECHHLPAVSFERVLAEVKARYLVGLTATPQRRDGHHPITSMQLGPVRFQVDPKGEAARRSFAHVLIVRDTAFQTQDAAPRPSIQALYKSLANDSSRNQLILSDVIGSIREGRSPILLTERKDHLEYFADHLRRIVPHTIVLKGGMSGKQRRLIASQLAAIPDGEQRVIIAIGRYIGEGFDDARLDTLFLALPIAWKGTLVQYTGRLHRRRSQKTDVRVFDYSDPQVPMLLRMFEKRLRAYNALGYVRTNVDHFPLQPFPLQPIEPTAQHEPAVIQPDDGPVRPNLDQAVARMSPKPFPDSVTRKADLGGAAEKIGADNTRAKKKSQAKVRATHISPARLKKLIEEVDLEGYYG